MPACGQAVGCGVCDTPESSGVAPRACVRTVYTRALVPPNLYINIRTIRTTTVMTTVRSTTELPFS